MRGQSRTSPGVKCVSGSSAPRGRNVSTVPWAPSPLRPLAPQIAANALLGSTVLMVCSAPRVILGTSRTRTPAQTQRPRQKRYAELLRMVYAPLVTRSSASRSALRWATARSLERSRSRSVQSRDGARTAQRTPKTTALCWAHAPTEIAPTKLPAWNGTHAQMHPRCQRRIAFQPVLRGTRPCGRKRAGVQRRGRQQAPRGAGTPQFGILLNPRASRVALESTLLTVRSA